MPFVAKTAAFGANSVFRSGAPRPMKMGTTASPWRYDAAADHALQSANLRRPAISRYASGQLSSRFRRVVRLPFDSGPLDQSQDRRDGPCVDGSGLARRIFTLRRWSELPCVRPVSAVHTTAGHNALRGSGPDQKHAFEDAMAHVGCPDRRIDRHCIKCCSPSQPLRHTGCPV
jgi:hypothetical protein